MKILARIFMLASLLMLLIAVAAYGSSRADNGGDSPKKSVSLPPKKKQHITFCSRQIASHNEVTWGLPSQITFASGPQNVTAAYLYMYNSEGELTVLPVSGFARTGPGSNVWTAFADFDLAKGSYSAYLFIKNSAGNCGFKYGTILVK